MAHSSETYRHWAALTKQCSKNLLLTQRLLDSGACPQQKQPAQNPLNFFRRQNSFAYERKEELMSNVDIFVIEYKLHGQPRSFVIRAKTMRNADAWHWASCDAGIAPIPKPGKPPLKVISKPQAERFGITDVKWRETATVDWMEA
jgi:hypothetical protein